MTRLRRGRVAAAYTLAAAMLLELATALGGCGGEGRALDLLIDPACITGAVTVAITVRVDGQGARTERREAGPLLAGSRRVVILFADGTARAAVDVALLGAADAPLGGGSIDAELAPSGPTHAMLRLSAPGCPGDGGVSADGGDGGAPPPDLPAPADASTPDPRLDRVEPKSISTAGGATITLRGDSFVDGAKVLVNGVAAGSVKWLDAATLSAAAPPGNGAVGLVEVKVVNPDGRSAARSDLLFYHLSEVLLGSARAFATGEQPYGVAAGDFNEDGIVDVASANQSAATLSLLVGLPSGTLGAARTLALAPATAPGLLARGDFDLDGHLDLASANAGDVSVLFGQGDGTFQPPQSLGTGGRRAGGIAAVDLNGDKRDDLVITRDVDQTVTVFMALPNRAFAAPVHTVVAGARQVVAGDFTGDGKPDVLVGTHQQGGAVTLLLGTGNAAAPLTVAGTTPNVAECQGMAAGDLDGDGDLDAALGGDTKNVVAVMRNDGKGGFTTTTVPTVGVTAGTTIGDFNGDGVPDIAAAVGPIYVSVLPGDGKGGFTAARNYGIGGRSLVVAAADVNRDGRTDLLFTRLDGAGVGLFHQTASGRFLAPRRYGAGAPGPVGALLVDLDGDEALDVVLANYNMAQVGSLAVHKGMGDGTFAPPQLLPTGKAAWLVAAADLDGDKLPDLVSTNSGGASVSVVLNRAGMKFSPATTLVAGPQPRGLALADFDGDGVIDLVVADAMETGLSLFRGAGAGAFEARRAIPVGASCVAVVAGDWNRDGKVDLAAGPSSGALLSLVGNGDLTFRALSPLALDPGPATSLQPADWNGDGRIDIAVIETAAAKVVLATGVGDGSFKVGPSLGLPGTDFRFAATGDLDLDGTPELLVSDLAHGTLLTISSLAGSPSVQTWAAGPQSFSSALGDLDGDHRPDVVISAFGDDAFRALTNYGR